jgi:excisionase family DNA binding protein
MALQPTEPERMTISVEEAALQLGIGRNLAYELARRGELPGAIRLGRRILVSKKALESFLAGQSGVSK